MKAVYKYDNIENGKGVEGKGFNYGYRLYTGLKGPRSFNIEVNFEPMICQHQVSFSSNICIPFIGYIYLIKYSDL